jgi:AraC-like DNA-binding protein
MAMQYEIRSGALSGFFELLAALDGDADALLAGVALDREVLLNPDRLIGTAQLVRLLDDSARQLHCADFGLRLAGYQGIEMLGVLGKVLVSAPTLEYVFNAAQRYMALHNKAEYWRIEVQGGLLHVHRVEHFFALDNTEQYREMAVGACYRLLRAFGGADIRPRRVEFSHRAQAPLKRYYQFFGCEVLFNQEFDRLVLDPAVLQRPVLPPDGQTVAKIDDYLRNLLSHCAENLELQVRTLIAQTLGIQQHSLEHIASLMGLHKRTLQRRLLGENLQFKTLLQEVKINTACWHLAASSMDITQLSELLGYADVAAFSKAFRLRQRMSPTQWRKHCVALEAQSKALGRLKPL